PRPPRGAGGDRRPLRLRQPGADPSSVGGYARAGRRAAGREHGASWYWHLHGAVPDRRHAPRQDHAEHRAVRRAGDAIPAPESSRGRDALEGPAVLEHHGGGAVRPLPAIVAITPATPL